MGVLRDAHVCPKVLLRHGLDGERVAVSDVVLGHVGVVGGVGAGLVELGVHEGVGEWAAVSGPNHIWGRAAVNDADQVHFVPLARGDDLLQEGDVEVATGGEVLGDSLVAGTEKGRRHG